MHYKTLAYDLYQLTPPKRLSILEQNLSDVISSHPTITFTRDAIVDFRNNYVILCEFVGEVLKNPKFSMYDILDWYVRQAKHKSLRRK